MHGLYCAACLLEDALAVNDAPPAFTIQLPLGKTSSGSVMLVRTEAPSHRLLRLKTMRRPAPSSFLARFREMREELDAWSEPLLVLPRTAWLDSEGHPTVLTDFRQGVLLLERVRDRRIPLATATAMLARLRESVRTGHARGLVHGSVVPGNVLVDTAGQTAYVLDFGLHRLLASSEGAAASAADDEAGFDALEGALSQIARGSGPVL